LKAAQIVDLETAAAIRGDKPEELWDAEDHILASEATPMVFTRVIPKVITQKLRFVNKKSRKPPILTEDGLLDRQTLRGVRQLDNSSAIELDNFLPPLQEVVYEFTNFE